MLVQHPPRGPITGRSVWFLQELLIFAIGARVFWKRPEDDIGTVVLCRLHRHGRRLHGGLPLDRDRRPSPADLSVCAVRGVRAGGQPAFLSGVSASPIPFLLRHGRWVLAALYGISTAYLVALWGSMLAVRWWSLHQGAFGRERRFSCCAAWLWVTSPWRSFSSRCASSVWCYSYRNARTRGERNQVQLDLVGLADRLGPDRLPAGAGLASIPPRWGGATPPGRCSACRSCTRWPMPSASRATS